MQLAVLRSQRRPFRSKHQRGPASDRDKGMIAVYREDGPIGLGCNDRIEKVNFFEPDNW